MKIKFISKTPPGEIDALWRPLLRGRDTIDGCQFSFDVDDRDYDALIVYEDLPPLPGETRIMRSETLACARENTLLMTTEPASIRIDGPHFLRQFGHVWTAKDPSLIRHPNQIRSTPPLRFFYGRNLAGGAHLEIPDDIPGKSKGLSAITSNKAMGHTLHQRRYEFVRELKAKLGDALDLFGRGINPIDDKAEAMAPYRYHIAIENHQEPGHFTEKLTDCFIAGCLPLYFGDPSYASTFPEDAVIPIDIFDLEKSAKIIRDAVKTHQQPKRMEALREARRITLERFNTLDAVAREMNRIYSPDYARGGSIHGRHAFRRKHPIFAAGDAVFRTRKRRSQFSQPIQS